MRQGHSSGRGWGYSGFEPLEGRQLLATVVWDGGPSGTGTDFSLASNWVGDVAPTLGDTALIDTAGPEVVISVDRFFGALVTSRPVRVRGGIVVTTGASQISAPLTMNGGILRGGSWTFSNNAEFDFVGGYDSSSNNNTLENVITNSPVRLNAEFDRARLAGTTQVGEITLTSRLTQLDLAAGYALTSNVTISGTGTGIDERRIRANGSQLIASVTIPSSVSIIAAADFAGTLNIGYVGVNTTLVNNGTIRQLGSAATITFQPWGFTNNGLLDVQGGTALIQPNQAWRNTGTIRGANGASVKLSGTLVATSGWGTLDTAGATLRILGTIQNTGNTLTINAMTGSPRFEFGQSAIDGGAIAFADGQRFGFEGTGAVVRLTNVSVNTNLLVLGGSVEIGGTFTAGRIRLEGDSSRLTVLANTTLTVSVDVLATNATQRAFVYLGSGSIVETNVSITLLAQSVGGLDISTVVPGGSLPIRHRGLIVNDGSTGRIRITGGNIFENEGVIEATTGTLEFSVYINNVEGFHNRGIIRGGAGVRIEIDSNFYFDTGSFEGSSAVIVLKGYVFLQGSTQTFNAQSPMLTMEGGTLRTGTLAMTDGRDLVIGSSQSTSILIDVSVVGNIRVVTNGYLGLQGQSRFTQLLLTGRGRGVGFGSGYVLRDRVTIVGSLEGDTPTLQFDTGCEVAAEGVIERLAAAGGTVYLRSSGQFTNRGLIVNSHALNTMNMDLDAFANLGTVRNTAGWIDIRMAENDGVLEAINGSTIRITTIYRAYLSTGTLRGADGIISFYENVENTGNTFTVNSQTGPLRFERSFIGGTLLLEPGAVVRTPFGSQTMATLVDVNVQGRLVLDSTSQLILAGSTQFSTLRMQGPEVTLRLPAVYTLSGTIEYGASAAARSTIILENGANPTLTIGASGGLVADHGFACTLNIQGTGTFGVTNQGVIRVSNGSNVTLSVPRLNNAGLIDVDSSQLRMTNQVTTSGFVHAGTLRVQRGGFLTATTYLDLSTSGGVLDFQAGTVTFTNSTLNFTGRTMSIGGANASWFINDSGVTGGTLNVATGAVLTFGGVSTSAGSSMTGVTVNGAMAITSSTLALPASTTFGLIRMLGPTRVSVGTGRAFDGTIEVSGTTSGTRTIEFGFGSTGIYTMSAAAVIRVLTGAGGPVVIRHSTGGSIINNATIVNESIQSITITASSFTHGGTLDIVRGSVVMNISGGSWSQRGSIVIGQSGVLDLSTSATMSMTAASQIVTRVQSATEYGRISGFIGNVILNGRVEAIFMPAYTVPVFATVNIVNVTGGGAVSGAFATRVVSGLVPDQKVIASQTATKYSLSLTSTADFNNDLVVDLFDYLDFVQAFSAGGLAADFNGDGSVDLFDYLDFVEIFSSF